MHGNNQHHQQQQVQQVQQQQDGCLRSSAVVQQSQRAVALRCGAPVTATAAANPRFSAAAVCLPVVRRELGAATM
jgi:hypothetical protein